MTLRFWTEATAQPTEGWHIALDGTPMRLPSGAILRLASPTLAAAITDEWQRAGGAKGGSFTPADIPLTQLAAAAQERIAPNRTDIVQRLAAYAQSDLLCYRATHPADLVAAQHAQWQPWLDWAAQAYGARLLVTTGIAPINQPEPSLAALRHTVASQTLPHLTALSIIIPGLGSCILGLAVATGALDPATAVATAELDALHQQTLWGADPDIAGRHQRLQAEIVTALRFMELSRP